MRIDSKVVVDSFNIYVVMVFKNVIMVIIKYLILIVHIPVGMNFYVKFYSQIILTQIKWEY